MKIAEEITKVLETDMFLLSRETEMVTDIIAAKLKPVQKMAHIISEAMDMDSPSDVLVILHEGADDIQEGLALFEEEPLDP